jgi:Arc/MetJ-type ribon-helix-helix transcriptional regulator
MTTNIGNETSSVHMPSDLLAQAQAVADEEHRTADDVVREAVERYLSDRRWQRILAYGEERTKTLGLTEDDLPRLIAESRQERRQERSRD